MQRIGFIGLGIMGRPMAVNLLKAGFPVVAFSRTRAKVDEIVQAGAERGSSPADVAERSQTVVTMLPDTNDVQTVILGPQGIIEGARAGTTVIDMSTISPTATREMARVLLDRKVDLLDAPVSGGEIGAISGTLSIMVGGYKDVFERCRPVLSALGQKITYIGPQGHGQITKLCNQVAGVLTLQSVVEALVLATRAGVDTERVLEAVSGGSADSWNLRNQGPKMLRRDFAPGFFVRLQQKDLRLVMELAGELNVPLPGTAMVQHLFHAIEAAGGSELGVQALVEALERLAGVQVGSGA